MKPYRAISIDGDGKDFVYGWHAEVEGKHYIISKDASIHEESDSDYTGFAIHTYTNYLSGLVEVIPETVAQQVGCKDKNGKEGYENDKVSFGSTKPVYLVKWSICNAGFYLESIDEQKEHLGIANFSVGEIIPPGVKEKSK